MVASSYPFLLLLSFSLPSLPPSYKVRFTYRHPSQLLTSCFLSFFSFVPPPNTVRVRHLFLCMFSLYVRKCRFCNLLVIESPCMLYCKSVCAAAYVRHSSSGIMIDSDTIVLLHMTWLCCHWMFAFTQTGFDLDTVILPPNTIGSNLFFSSSYLGLNCFICFV